MQGATSMYDSLYVLVYIVHVLQQLTSSIFSSSWLVGSGLGLTQGQLGLLGLGPGPAESGLTPRARVKGQEKWVSPGLTQPLDSVISLHRYCGF